jgi:hypothetical protein
MVCRKATNLRPLDFAQLKPQSGMAHKPTTRSGLLGLVFLHSRESLSHVDGFDVRYIHYVWKENKLKGGSIPGSKF